MREQAMIRYILILILSLGILSGCGSPYRHIRTNDIIESKYITHGAPKDLSWEIIQTYNRDTWKAKQGTPGFTNWSTPNATLDIHIVSLDYFLIPTLFDKNGDYEARRKYLKNTPETLAQNKEQNITYDKGETQYVLGMKCLGTVFSRGYGGSLYDATSKNYSITCGYYDTTEPKNNGQRALRIEYSYQYANPQNTRLQKDKDLKAAQIPTSKDIEDYLKAQVKQIINTIRIKNFDRQRMEKEGLMHYDKKFKSTKW